MEHHSNIVPWEIIAKINGFTIKYAKVTHDGTLDYEDFENKLSRKTKIACLSHVSNVSGVINDVKRLAKLAHEHGALMLVDGAQSVPHMPVDVTDLDADFLAFSGHKMLGPTGIGVLYAKKTLLEKMAPWQGGGEMIKEVSFSRRKRTMRHKPATTRRGSSRREPPTSAAPSPSAKPSSTCRESGWTKFKLTNAT